MVHGEKFPGDNTCAAYHPEAYVRRAFSRYLDLVDVVRNGAPEVNQDAYLFLRRQ